MLKIGFSKKDVREMIGQVLRMAATIPGFILGWVPKGNTGGADVSALQPMLVPDDLAGLLSDYDVWKDVRSRLYIALAVIVLVGIFIVTVNPRQEQVAGEIGKQWRSSTHKPLTNTTMYLLISMASQGGRSKACWPDKSISSLLLSI